MLKQWRELVEERSKDDDRLFRDWSKSWMATSFKLLEMQRETMAQATRAQLEAIDDYLEQLGKHQAQDAGASSKRKSTKATSK